MGRPRTVPDEAILDAAQRLVADVGPQRLTLARVAKEVGLSPATLVQRFGSKQAMLTAMSRQAARTVSLAMTASPAPSVDPVERLVAALGTAGLSKLASTPAQMANQVAMLQRDLADPELHAAAGEHARAVRNHVRTILDEAVAGGHLAADTPGHALARSVHVCANGCVVSWAIEPEGSLDDMLTRELGILLAPYRGHDSPSR